MVSRAVLIAAIAMASYATVVSGALAQTFPSKPVRLVVGASPGGAIDVVSRIVGPKLGERLGQQVVVDNRPGAGTTIGGAVVAKSAPDGHTIFMASTSFSVSAGLYTKLPFDAIRDFVAVTSVASGPLVLVVHPLVPAKSVKELIALARANPGRLTFASGGTGSSLHLSGELFKSMAGIDMVHVPYKGGAPASVDLMAGQVDLMFAVMAGELPHIRSGKVRALAVTTLKRSATLPSIPTVNESGLKGFDVAGWFGILAPAATPPEVVNRLHAEISVVMKDPDVRARLSGLGTDPTGSTPAEFGAHYQSEVARWRKLILALGIATN
jgi:tripartite-type tricarboxylate transporter receptor subunit TctC